MEYITKLLTYLKSFPTWIRFLVALAIALLCFALSSCAKRTYTFKMDAEQMSILYKDSLNNTSPTIKF